MRILGRKAYRFAACGAMAVFGIAIASVQLPTNAQQPSGTGPYTAEQANAGRATYQIKCATCHLPDLKGSNEASPLTGMNFVSTWRDRATSDLFNRIRNTMPVTDPGSLGDEEAVNIVAYLLQANGVTAGTQALTPATTTPIGAVIGGEASPMASQTTERPPAGQSPVARPPAPARASGAPAGLTFAGEVKNYVPVTGATQHLVSDRHVVLHFAREGQASRRAGCSCRGGRPCNGRLPSGRPFCGLRCHRGAFTSDSCSNRRRRCGRECLSASRCAIGLEEICNNIDGFFISERARIGDGHRIPDAIE